MRTLGGALAGALLLVILSQGWADAHALLLRATPSSSQTLSQPPTDVQLLFSEPIDPVFSNVRVLDASGQPVDLGDSHVDPDNERLLVASLRPSLPNGVYHVVWRSLSTIDVHPDTGQYSLFVGVPVQSEATSQATLLNQNAGTPETTLGRWWFYVAASLFGGGLATWKLVVGPALSVESAGLRQRARRRARRLVLLGGGLLVLGTLFAAVAQAAAAADVPLGQAFGQPLVDLLGRGRFAAIWWPRFGIEVAAVLLVLLGGLDGMASESALAMLPAVLLTSSLTSHGAALSSGAGLGVAVDWLHVLGAATWVGGLAMLVALVPLLARQPGESSSPLVPRTIARFSRLALVALVVVALSGALQAVIEVGSWGALLATTYGQLVLAKVILLLVMLGLAVANTRRGRQPTTSGRGWLLRGARTELAVGLAVLAIAALLTGTPPTRTETPAAAPATQITS
jgi:copper transport protein